MMTDTIMVAVDSAYDASVLVVVREMLHYGINDNPETNAIVDYMPSLFTYIESAAAGLWQHANEERGDSNYKEETEKLILRLQNALARFEALRDQIRDGE